MNVSEYIARFLAEHAVDRVFMITGGGAMFLNDAIGHEEGIQCIFNHHEQASAIAAEAYARVSGKPGVINVTTGPGGINAMNGIFGAWTDSVPIIVISGQIKRETCMAFYPELNLRQLGDQEADIISMVKSITKYAVLLEDAQLVRYEMEKLWHIALSGRKGPCWIDVPSDIQSAQVDPEKLIGYCPLPVHKNCKNLPANEISEMLNQAKKPLLLIGAGTRDAKATGNLQKLIDTLQIPVLTTWSSPDLIRSDSPLCIGHPGTVGGRAANIVLQEADFILAIGTRLNIRMVSYNWENLAKNAFMVQVDIDGNELIKPTSSSQWRIQSDSDSFCRSMLDSLSHIRLTDTSKWLNWCIDIKQKYPSVTQKMRSSSDTVNPYVFIERVFQQAPDNSIFVCGNGAACVMSIQTALIKEGTRLLTNSGDASMGYDLPAAIGAAVAAGVNDKPVICFAGDGSIMMNLQELQTISHYQLPIIIIVLKNNGYLSIHQTQKNFFKRFVGESVSSGVSFPDYSRVAQAFGLETMCLTAKNYESVISAIFTSKRPVLIEAELDSSQEFEPKLSSRRNPDGSMTSCSLEDMSPLLSDEELKQNHFKPEGTNNEHS